MADKFIYDSLMIELYGDVPFTTYRVKPQEPVEVLVVNGTVTKDGEFKQESVETEPPGPSEEFVKEWDDIEKWHADQAKVHETLKEAGVPDKVVNKITRRRLK